MKCYIKSKYVILALCFLSLCYYSAANERIWFSTKSLKPSIYVIASPGKQFTVEYDDGSPIQTFTGTGELQFLQHNYYYNPNPNPDSLTVTIETIGDCIISKISGISGLLSFDASGAPGLKSIDMFSGYLKNLNLRNCSALEKLDCSENSLTNLDLSDCVSLIRIDVNNNKLYELDISSTVAEWCNAAYNSLPLSQLYPITTKLPHPEWSYNYKQVVATRYTTINEPVDFSSEKEFDGEPTFFHPRYGKGIDAWPPALESDFTINDGFITFHAARTYTVYMMNPKIIGADEVYTYTPVIVILPVQEITNLPTTSVVGTPLTLTGTVIPNNATNKSISWSVKDAGTTGATIIGNKLNTKTEGTVVVTATIKNGLGMDSNYIQDFSIEVKPVGINDPTQELSNITVYPNPTNGELEIECKNLLINRIEVFDIKGKIILSHHFNILSANHRIDISSLNSGNYLIKVITTQGEIVKKVVKL